MTFLVDLLVQLDNLSSLYKRNPILIISRIKSKMSRETFPIKRLAVQELIITR